MFNWFDITLLAIVVCSAVAGLRSGFARVVVGLIATVAGLIAGFWCYRIVAAKLMPWMGNPTVSNVFGFLVIFIGVLIVGSLISALLSRFFNWIGLSWFNHLLGGVAGFFRGTLVIAAVAAIVVAFSPSPMPQVLEQSRMLPLASEVAGWLVEMAPRDLKDAFEQQMQNLKQFWDKPTKQHGQEV
jgi:membrane protein required for colicin V production